MRWSSAFADCGHDDDVMYPYMYGASFLGVVLMILVSLALLGTFAWIVAALGARREDGARRIARERFARGEITSEELGLLLQAL